MLLAWCRPAGFGNVPLKSWSCQRGGFVLRALHGSAQLRLEVPAVLNIVFPPGGCSRLPPRWKQRQSSCSECERPPSLGEHLSCLLRPVVGLGERPTLMEGLLTGGCV